MMTAALGGCLGAPDLNSSADPLVMTLDGPQAPDAAASPERLSAIAEMRAKAEAGETAPFPDAFRNGQNTRLAAREEPRPVADSQAIEAELAAIARRRSTAVTAGEIAGLEARAAELRRLAARALAGSLRR